METAPGWYLYFEAFSQHEVRAWCSKHKVDEKFAANGHLWFRLLFNKAPLPNQPGFWPTFCRSVVESPIGSVSGYLGKTKNTSWVIAIRPESIKMYKGAIMQSDFVSPDNVRFDFLDKFIPAQETPQKPAQKPAQKPVKPAPEPTPKLEPVVLFERMDPFEYARTFVKACREQVAYAVNNCGLSLVAIANSAKIPVSALERAMNDKGDKLTVMRWALVVAICGERIAMDWGTNNGLVAKP